ncbi:HAMP domain-containing sensor histidine kinase [Pedobacter aquatilis]|uniref:sensor histidine kinase n=1 Tax=Pedobacter aquatilis TaxID=351343 RepID=UPI0025B43F00|nr:HAMP domain-containing sensor histidine kinase [Pedobacter aquatilis]MDN3585691.1 HAMP domain-containing sensor histidine kinase [Pedobacter aquatilis]
MSEILEIDLLNKENNRLKKLERYEILQTQQELAFNALAKLAANILNANYAAISFVGDESVFHKAMAGTPSTNIDKLCKKAINNPEITVVKINANLFFIASPLITPENLIVGTLHVLVDSEVNPSEEQKEMLRNLTVLIIDKLETRLAMRKTMRAQDHRVNMLVHDLKNPMTTISLQSELVGKMPGIDERTKMIAGKINSQSKNIVERLNHIVSIARSENASVKLQKTKVNIKILLEKITNDFEIRLRRNDLTLLVDISEASEIYGDEEKLYQIFEELINNAIKFSSAGNEITVWSAQSDDRLIISIKDNGTGISGRDLERLFVKFANFSNAPVNLHRAEGLGLLLARTIVDLHHGKLWAESDGEDKGTTFHVELPLK